MWYRVCTAKQYATVRADVDRISRGQSSPWTQFDTNVGVQYCTVPYSLFVMWKAVVMSSESSCALATSEPYGGLTQR
jgi:hypothetical protein